MLVNGFEMLCFVVLQFLAASRRGGKHRSGFNGANGKQFRGRVEVFLVVSVSSFVGMHIIFGKQLLQDSCNF